MIADDPGHLPTNKVFACGKSVGRKSKEKWSTNLSVFASCRSLVHFLVPFCSAAHINCLLWREVKGEERGREGGEEGKKGKWAEGERFPMFTDSFPQGNCMGKLTEVEKSLPLIFCRPTDILFFCLGKQISVKL